MKTHAVYQILKSGYISVNILLAKSIGLEEAVIYSRLLAKQDYYESTSSLSEEGFFYLKVDDLQNDTTLGERAQRRCIGKLVELGLLQYKRVGLPAMRWFKIGDNEKTALEAILISSCKVQELDTAKCRNNNLPSEETSNEESQELDTAKCRVITLQSVGTVGDQMQELDTAKCRDMNDNDYNENYNENKDEHESLPTSLESEVGEKNGQASLKGKKSKKMSMPSVLFAETPYFENFEKFCEDITAGKAGARYDGFDLAYYHEAVLTWSAGKGKKMQDWIAVARGFMNRDKGDGKAKMMTIVSIPKEATGVYDYLIRLYNLTEENNKYQCNFLREALSRLLQGEHWENFRKKLWSYYRYILGDDKTGYKGRGITFRRNLQSFIGTTHHQYLDGGWNEDWDKKLDEDTKKQQEKKTVVPTRPAPAQELEGMDKKLADITQSLQSKTVEKTPQYLELVLASIKEYAQEGSLTELQTQRIWELQQLVEDLLKLQTKQIEYAN